MHNAPTWQHERQQDTRAPGVVWNPPKIKTWKQDVRSWNEHNLHSDIMVLQDQRKLLDNIANYFPMCLTCTSVRCRRERGSILSKKTWKRCCFESDRAFRLQAETCSWWKWRTVMNTAFERVRQINFVRVKYARTQQLLQYRIQRTLRWVRPLNLLLMLMTNQPITS